MRFVATLITALLLPLSFASAASAAPADHIRVFDRPAVCKDNGDTVFRIRVKNDSRRGQSVNLNYYDGDVVETATYLPSGSGHTFRLRLSFSQTAHYTVTHRSGRVLDAGKVTGYWCG